MTDSETTTPQRPPTVFIIQQEVTLYSRGPVTTTEDPNGSTVASNSTYSEVTAWVDLGEMTGPTKKAAIKAMKAERGIEGGRYRALTASSASVYEPRFETVTREVW